MIVREALEEYLAAKRPEMRHKTMSEARRILGYFSDFCTERGIELDHIRPRIIYEYTDFLCENRHSKQGGTLSSHTVFLHTTLIKAFLAWCTQDEEFEEYVRPSMVGKIKKPRQDKFVVETFTRDHIDALLKACDTGKTTSEKINTYLRGCVSFFCTSLSWNRWGGRRTPEKRFAPGIASAKTTSRLLGKGLSRRFGGSVNR